MSLEVLVVVHAESQLRHWMTKFQEAPPSII
jgi:hypothetical protein